MITKLSTTCLLPSMMKPMMTEATFNFLLDTLIEEIKMHPYYDELLQLMQEQYDDDTFALG